MTAMKEEVAKVISSTLRKLRGVYHYIQSYLTENTACFY
jgi:hypothetical protein